MVRHSRIGRDLVRGAGADLAASPDQCPLLSRDHVPAIVLGLRVRSVRRAAGRRRWQGL